MCVKSLMSRLMVLFWIGLWFAPIFAQELVTMPAREVLETATTIAGVQVETSAEFSTEENPQALTVYADNDTRVFRMGVGKPFSSDMTRAEFLEKYRLLQEARKNGWEVRLEVRPIPDTAYYEIVKIEVLSNENKLTSGLNMPDSSFRPLILDNESSLPQVFGLVYPYSSKYYDASDNCFNRAQYWSRSYQHKFESNSRLRGVGTDKAYIFFSSAYAKKYNHKWWYHVAPVVYLLKDGVRTPWVIDPTFLNKALPLEGRRGWLGTFDGHTNGECVRINTLDEYYENGHKPICMYIVASMFNYSPSDLRSQKLTNWRCRDFSRLKDSIPAPGANTSRPGATWRDPENQFLVPQMCRD